MKIPKIVHTYWGLKADIPERYRKREEMWREWGWADAEFKVWTPEKVEEDQLVRAALPPPPVGESSVDYDPAVRIAISALSVYGGIFVGIGVVPLTDIQFILEQPFGIFMVDRVGMVGCVPNHPLLWKMLEPFSKDEKTAVDSLVTIYPERMMFRTPESRYPPLMMEV